jgi:hypothetical protein
MSVEKPISTEMVSTYEIGDSERKRQIAEAARRRMQGVASKCYALSQLPDLMPFERAIAVADEAEIQDWITSFRDAAKALNRAAAQLDQAAPPGSEAES